MVRKFKTFESRPTVIKQQGLHVAALTTEAKMSLYKKSQKSGISTDILEEVYYRGYSIWNESFGQTPEQFAFDRVNSFISGGFAAQLDDDLMETQYFAIATPKGGSKHSRQAGHWRRVPDTKFSSEERAHEYGKKYHKYGYKVVPHPDSTVDENIEEGVGDMFGGARDSRGIEKHLKSNGYEVKRSGGSHTIWHKPSDPKMQHVAVPNHRGDHAPGTIRSMYKQFTSRNTNEAKEEPNGEPITNDKVKPSSRFVGTKELVDIFKKDTPGQGEEEKSVAEQRLQTIKRVIRSKYV